MNIKEYLLDGLSNYVFFVPLITLFGVLVTNWTLTDIIMYLITAIPLGFIGGSIYGRFLNKWRKWLKYE